MTTEAIQNNIDDNLPRFDLWYIIKVAVVLFLMFGFGSLPPIPPLEKIGMEVIGIFLGMLFAWMGIGYVWPSILALIFLNEWVSKSMCYRVLISLYVLAMILTLFVYVPAGYYTFH